jgi:hypothetical protein
MAIPWATILVHLHRNKLFKNLFCTVVLFGLASGLATFQKNWAIFFQIIWSSWLGRNFLKILSPESSPVGG